MVMTYLLHVYRGLFLRMFYNKTRTFTKERKWSGLSRPGYTDCITTHR